MKASNMDSDQKAGSPVSGERSNEHFIVHERIDPFVIQSNVFVHVKLGRDAFAAFLDFFGRPAWNIYVSRLRKTEIFALFSSPEPGPDNSCMPVWLNFDFRDESLQGWDLSDLDLTEVCLHGADCRRATFHRSKLWGARNTKFCGASLRLSAQISGDLTSADFTDAILDSTTHFHECYYTEGRPPKGLPSPTVESMQVMQYSSDQDLPCEDSSCTRHAIKVKHACIQSFWD
ncbi:MAG: hypothetical protein ACI96M_000419 [Candidatus Azotimanducaceae bacterium]|jgi:hypothetical protein